MKMLSLFSGIGGLDLGAYWAGIETVAFCEIDPFCRKILAKHWPGVPIFENIKALNKEALDSAGIRTIDIICGGFPCQPFSMAGNRKGTSDDRYLLPEMLRIIEELRPTWVIGENVTGLLSMAEQITPPKVDMRSLNRTADTDNYYSVSSRQEKMLLVSIIKKLEAINYKVQTYHIPACGVRAPHERYRVFILAHSASLQRDTGIEKRGILRAM